jgi:predicted transposase YbfD/YdcC
MAIPLLDAIDIEGKTITGDALLTQRRLADYLVADRQAHYHFTVKGNQPGLLTDLTLYFHEHNEPDAVSVDSGHGRIETRKIWTSAELNDYLDFPWVGQVFMIERESINKKTGKVSNETAYGVTSCKPEQASADKILKTNRDHWCIENSCHYIIDWNFDEDRSRIRTGYGPENVSRLRRFAVGLIKSKGAPSVAQKMRQLAMNVRSVLDYLRMTKNSSVPCVNSR